jgi:hypothetical protein
MIARLAEASDAGYWIGAKMAKRGMEDSMRVSTLFLIDIYSKTGLFAKMLDDETSQPLTNEYMEACTINCRYLVEFCTIGKEHLRQERDPRLQKPPSIRCIV